MNVGAISLLREVSIKTITIYFWHPRSSGPLGWGVVGGLVGGLAWGASLLAKRLLQHQVVEALSLSPCPIATVLEG